MIRYFKKAAAWTVLASLIMSMAAYAETPGYAVFSAGGVVTGQGAVTQGPGPGPGGPGAGTVTEISGTGAMDTGSITEISGSAQSVSAGPQIVEGPGGAPVTDAVTETVVEQNNMDAAAAGMPVLENIGPSGSVVPAEGNTVPAAETLVPAAGSGQLVPMGNSAGFGGGSSATGSYVGTDASSGKVETDPIIGYSPFVNFVMVLPSGIRTLGFTSDMDMFMSPEEGFTGLWGRLEYGIGDCYYRVYTEEHGWSKWAMNEMYTPDTGDQAKVRAVQMRIKGHTRNMYNLYYRAILEDGTVLDWARDGQTAGAIGNGHYIQGLQTMLWKTGVAFNQGTSRRLLSGSDEGMVMGIDGVYHYSTANGQPYTGWAHDVNNGRYYFQDSHIVTGWQYIDGYKYYFDNTGRVVTDLEPIMGLPGDYIIKVNKDMKCMTVYTKDGDNGYIIPFKVFLVTIGSATPTGEYKTYEAHRWKYMHDEIYVQFLMRYKANGFCIHSIIYEGAPDSHHLLAATYNQLGKNQSDGCIRLLSGDAAWLYNNCGEGTPVEIYNNAWVTGPYDRPAIEKGIPMDQNYDPTDPVLAGNEAADSSASAAAMQDAVTGIGAIPLDITN